MNGYNLQKATEMAKKYIFTKSTKSEIAKKFSTEDEKFTAAHVTKFIYLSIFWDTIDADAISQLMAMPETDQKTILKIRSVLADKEEYKNCTILLKKISDYISAVKSLNFKIDSPQMMAVNRIVNTLVKEEFESYFYDLFPEKEITTDFLRDFACNISEKIRKLEAKYNVY